MSSASEQPTRETRTGGGHNAVIKRREFLAGIPKTGAGMAGGALLLGAQAGRVDAEPAAPKAKANARHRFRISMYLPELGLPFDASLAKAKEIGAEYVWFPRLGQGEPNISDLSDAEIDGIGERVAKHGLKIFLLNSGNPFKGIHLTEFTVDTLERHERFQKEFSDLKRSMQIASRLDIGAVGSFTFAWPGEYIAKKPTWPMRWLTRGGHIADVDMEKLVKAFTLVAEEADRYDVDVALSMMPWNYTNTTGNFRRIVEAVGSKRLKVMWGPSDNYNSGETDVGTAGFNNIRPYIHGLHLKDLRVNDGLKLDFDYCAIGEGHTPYLTILRNLRNYGSDVYLSLSTHFRPPSNSREEAMRINHRNLLELIAKVEAEA